MDADEIAQLRWTNNLKRHEMIREMEERRQLDSSEWSPRAMPPQPVSNGASTPHSAPTPASPLVSRTEMQEMLGNMADEIGTLTGQLEQTLKKSWGEGVAELSQRLDDIESRLDRLESGERSTSNWFSRMLTQQGKRIP